MRSVALAAAALVLLEILSNKKYWWRLLPWAACLLATIVTLVTWGRGILLTNSRTNIGDAVLPLLMGIAEFCFFAILSPKEYWSSVVMAKDELDGLGSWRHWPFVLSIHSLLAVGLVANRISQTDPTADFDQSLRPLGLEYIRWLKEDIVGASIGVIVFSLLGVLTLYLAKREKGSDGHKRYGRTVAALALIPIFIYSIVIYQAELQRQRTDNFVSEITLSLEKKAPNPSSPSNSP